MSGKNPGSLLTDAEMQEINTLVYNLLFEFNQDSRKTIETIAQSIKNLIQDDVNKRKN